MGQAASLFFSQLTQIEKTGLPAKQSNSAKIQSKGFSFKSVLDKLSTTPEIDTQSAKADLNQRLKKVLANIGVDELSDFSEAVQIVRLPRGSVRFDRNGKPEINTNALPAEVKSALAAMSGKKKKVSLIQVSGEDVERLEKGNRLAASEEKSGKVNRLPIETDDGDKTISFESVQNKAAELLDSDRKTAGDEAAEKDRIHLPLLADKQIDAPLFQAHIEKAPTPIQASIPTENTPKTVRNEENLFSIQQSFFAGHHIATRGEFHTEGERTLDEASLAKPIPETTFSEIASSEVRVPDRIHQDASPIPPSSTGNPRAEKPIVLMVVDPDDLPDNLKQNQGRIVLAVQPDSNENTAPAPARNTLKLDREEPNVYEKIQSSPSAKSSKEHSAGEQSDEKHEGHDSHAKFKKPAIQASRKPVDAFSFDRTAERNTETIAQHTRLSREATVLEMTNEPMPAQAAARSVPQAETPQPPSNPASQTPNAPAASSANSPEQTPQASMAKFYSEQAAKMQEATSQQIVKSVQGSLGSGRSHISLKLMPETLGRIHIQMTIKNGTLSAQIIANKQTTQAVIEQSLSQLRTTFEDGGIRVDRLVVSKESIDAKPQDQGKDQSGWDRSSRQRPDSGGQPGRHNGQNGKSSKNYQPFWSDRLTASDYFS